MYKIKKIGNIINVMFMYYLNLFFVFSIVGYFMEQGLMMLFHQDYNSSLLFGPWTVVYGLATLVIIYIGNFVNNKFSCKKHWKFLIFFVLAFLIMTLLEFIAGWSIEAVLGVVYWDYSDLPLHFTKYVCVPVSFVWSIYSCLIYYIVYPLIKDKIKKMPLYVSYTFIVLFIIDVIYSICMYLKYV